MDRARHVETRHFFNRSRPLARNSEEFFVAFAARAQGARVTLPSRARSGQSIMEVLIAISIGVILVGAAAALILPSLKSSTQAAHIEQASALANGLLNNVRVWSEGSWNNILTLATGSANTYYLNTSSSPFTVVGSGGFNVQMVTVGSTTYSLYFYLSDVYRSSTGMIVASSGSYDPSTKQITVRYAWPGVATSTMTTILTRNQNFIVDQTDWSAGPNSAGPVTSTNSQFATSSNIDWSGTTGSFMISLASRSTSTSYAFPSGWIQVPGNATFGTATFWVMAYGAKCVSASTNAALTSPDSGFHTYDNNNTACTSANGNYVASASSGYPIANLSQTTAASYCTAMGAHLMTNNEWQTIAWDVENNSANWSGGTVGGAGQYMSRGNSDSSAAQDASSPYGAGYSDFTHLRTQALSNASVIWDLAGNLWEWTNDTITGANQPTVTASPGFVWREFTDINSWGTMTEQSAGPAINTWNSSKNIGQIESDGTASNNSTYGFLRGGTWYSGAKAGLETLYLGDPPGGASFGFGFRCAR